MKNRLYKTISVPVELYNQIEELLAGTGFRTPTEYILYVLRQSIVRIDQEKERLNLSLRKKIPQNEAREIKKRLRRLGYLS